jgi:hypothetical protein
MLGIRSSHSLRSGHNCGRAGFPSQCRRRAPPTRSTRTNIVHQGGHPQTLCACPRIGAAVHPRCSSGGSALWEGWSHRREFAREIGIAADGCISFNTTLQAATPIPLVDGS